MRPVAIISKPQKEELANLLPELIAWMRAHDFEPILDHVSGSYTKGARIVPRHELPAEKPVLVVVLGGDGTLLAAARAFARSDVPILSVNLGALGFLTEVRLADLYTTLEGWREGCCAVDARALLHTEVMRGGALYKEYEALNDVVIAKGAIARMGDFSIHLFDQLAASFRADGVIVSTPTGSTAYNLAANGPILAPYVDALVITPICPHLLTIRPMVVRGDAHVNVSVEGIPDLTFLTVDGQEALQLRVGDRVCCRRSEHSVKLVRMGATGFFDVLRSKLSWGER
jgi:NAD+ kinase